MKKKIILPLFPKAKSVGPRIWGKEILLVAIPKLLTLKLLKIKKGQKGGLQYHRKKNECGYIVKGKLLIKYVDKKQKLRQKILKSGDCFHFPPGSIHQEKAITNVEVIEGSSPHLNDRVRVEKFFNINEKTIGLPTTSIKEIIKL